jgi:hypothetical protein
MGVLLIRRDKLPIPSVPDTLSIMKLAARRTTKTSEPITDEHAAADGRSSRWELHRAERRRQLIKAARRAVTALGPGASMEDIAAAADTSKSVYYR